MSYAFQIDNKPIFAAQALHLSKIAKISIAIVGLQMTFVPTMLTVLRYARAFNKAYRLLFFNVRIKDIMEEKM